MTAGTTGGSASSEGSQGILRRLGQRIYSFILREFRRTTASSLDGVSVLLTVIALGLTAFGLIMVLSASSVEQIAEGFSPFSQVVRQLIFAVLGIVLMTVLAFVPVSWYRRKAVMHVLIVVAILLQIAVVLVGTTVNGNRNWLSIGGGISVQPSEFSKLLAALWMAWVLTQQGNITRGYRKAIFPLAFGIVPLMGLILWGHDVGTVLVYGIMLLAVLWLAGMNIRGFVIGAMIAAVGLVLMVITSPNRIARVLGVLGHCEGSTCDQSNSGLAALATGGFWGVGLGRSRQKYNYLPEAHNDYIFAVIGEELGLLGTLLVIFLYLGLIYCVVRIMLRTADRFIALASGTILAWLTGQAIINIAMVAGVLPVIGIPLPFISYGGTSLVSSLAAVGVLIGFARQTPLQPIFSRGEYTYYAGGTPRERVRRAKLGKIVEVENARIEAAEPQAGFDIMNWLRYLRAGDLQPRRDNRTRGNGRRVSQDFRVEQAGVSDRKHPVKDAHGASEKNVRSTSQGNKPVRLRDSAQEKSKTGSNTVEKNSQENLPPGLVPIRRARAQKKNRTD